MGVFCLFLLFLQMAHTKIAGNNITLGNKKKMKFHLFIMFSNSFMKLPGDKTTELCIFESLKCSPSAKSMNTSKSIYLRPYT